MALVYRHIRLDKNVPFYIGISNGNKRRPFAKKRNPIWTYITSKTNYRVEIILDDLTWEEALEKEKEFIALYGRRDLGKGTLANMTDGGDGAIGIIQTEESKEKRRLKSIGRKQTEETIQLMREINTGERNPMWGRRGTNNPLFGIKLSEDRRKLLSDKAKLRLGEKNPMFGKTQSEETRKKISEKAIGRKHTQETKGKMSKNLKGIRKTEEWKKKIGDAQRGEKSWRYGMRYTDEQKKQMSDYYKVNGHPFQGRSHTPETIEKLRAISSSKVGETAYRNRAVQCEIEGKIMVFYSQKFASQHFGISISAINSWVSRGKKPKFGKNWQYVKK
jgi:hypothetical protein